MKTLTTEQQQDLQEAVSVAAGDVSDTALRATLTYWAIELKPKRVRKKVESLDNREYSEGLSPSSQNTYT